MDVTTLELKWAEVNKENSSHYRSIRISDESICELFIGVNSDYQRCLILSVPSDTGVDINGESKKYISIEYFDQSGHLIISLTEDKFKDLFNAFILSIYHKIKSIGSPAESSKKMITLYYEWSEFFHDSESNLLSLSELMGLFGELFILQKLLTKVTSERINDVLRAWTGPYGRGNDFAMDSIEIEVKTKHLSSQQVRISSEFQLEEVYGKQMELVVISVEQNTSEARMLSLVVEEIKSSIISRLGDFSIFLKALAKLGVSLDNMNAYDHSRLEVKSETAYNCLQDGFPRLVKSKIPKELNEVNYNINLKNLDKYIVYQNLF